MAGIHIDCGVFARGFFLELEESGNPAVVLHGGADGFAGEISDIDFAVGHDAFARLPALIRGYCERSGWRLCQILRHETTAAYFVCSAAGDPTRSVALDACSDYQRHGTHYLDAEELLANRRPLPWGGYEPDEATMLRYRFAKAAAKNKDAVEATREFDGYSPAARMECSRWLHNKWGIRLSAWNDASVAAALSGLRDRSNHRPPLIAKGAWWRVLHRLVQPTGMVVVTGRESHARISEVLAPVFGRLHFRRVSVSPSFRFTHLKALATSTLIVVPSLGAISTLLIPDSCKHYVASGSDDPQVLDELARTLAARCSERERTNKQKP